MFGMASLRAISVPMLQRFRVASGKGTATRGLTPVDWNECRPHIQNTYGKQQSFIDTAIIPRNKAHGVGTQFTYQPN